MCPLSALGESFANCGMYSTTMAKSKTFISMILERLTIFTGTLKLFEIHHSIINSMISSRQAMTATKAWQRHGCYALGSDQYFNMPMGKAMLGCQDESNSLDHFDPTTDTRRVFSQFNYLRTVYNALQDGFNLVQRGNWTHFIQRPGSNGTETEMGLWSVTRAGISGTQTLTGNHTDQIWMLYSNENSTQDFSYDCKGAKWIPSPYQSGVTVRNLFAPYETYTLVDSMSSYYNNSQAPWFGCLSKVTMESYGFKALVPVDEWVPPLPMMTKFVPGHDARLLANSGDTNATTVDISIEFSVEMNCNSVTSSISFNMSSSGKGSTPTINQNSIKCGAVSTPDAAQISGASTSQWAWSATLQNVPDGIITITVKNPTTQDGTASTGVRDSTRIWKFVLLMDSFTSRLLIISYCARVPRITSWCSLIPTMTRTRLGSPMDIIPSLTVPWVLICSATLGISVRIGRAGLIGRMLLLLTRAFSTTRVIFGKVNISLFNVSATRFWLRSNSNFRD